MVDFSDEKFLLDEIRKGNNQAFEYLFKAYYPRLCGYAIRFINGKTNCSTFTKHFVPNLILLTQNKMCILLRWFHLFTSFVYLCISLA